MGKTERLLIELITIVPATGIEGAQMIASDSLSCPHLVKQSKSGKFSCDGQCPMWGGQKICAHTVAVAECMHCLHDFLNSLHKSKPECNLTKLVTTSKVWKAQLEQSLKRLQEREVLYITRHPPPHVQAVWMLSQVVLKLVLHIIKCKCQWWHYHWLQ